MSAGKAHPQRENRIVKWITTKQPGDTFTAKQIAKSLDLMPVEVGNILKFHDDKVRICRQEYRMGAVWEVL
jgi:hypothetical protein